MAIYRGICCDACGETLEYWGSISSTILKKRAREEGWTCGKKDSCPRCAAKKKAHKDGE